MMDRCQPKLSTTQSVFQNVFQVIFDFDKKNLLSTICYFLNLTFLSNKYTFSSKTWFYFLIASNHECDFFMLALLRRISFWPPSMVYISVINTHITNYNLSHVRPLWAASMYCIYTWLSDLWVLLQCVLESHIFHFSCLQAFLLLKSHHPSLHQIHSPSLTSTTHTTYYAPIRFPIQHKIRPG